MKKLLLSAKIVLATTLVCHTICYAHAKESEASLRVALLNEIGDPVSNKKLFIHDDSGRGNLDYGITDASGCVILKNHGNASIRVIGISGDMMHMDEYKDCYLDKGIRYLLIKNNKAINRWEPWNPEITHVVKRIRNPVPMISSNYKSLSLGHSVGGEFLFDMVECDWLPPRGQGKVADVAVTLLTAKDAPQWSKFDAYEKRFGNEAMKKRFGYIPTERKPDSRALRVKVRFLRQDDGILFDDDEAKRHLGGSILWHRHEAPIDGYKPEFTYDAMEDYLSPLGTAYIRIRSEGGDAEGKAIKSAMHVVTNSFGFSYCAIYAPWQPGDGPRKEIDNTPHLLFSYKLNPNTASRSLEWNGVDARTGKLVRPNWREDQRP